MNVLLACYEVVAKVYKILYNYVIQTLLVGSISITILCLLYIIQLLRVRENIYMVLLRAYFNIFVVSKETIG